MMSLIRCGYIGFLFAYSDSSGADKNTFQQLFVCEFAEELKQSVAL